MVAVDGLQRLTTFQRFVQGDLKLHLPDRDELNGRRFSELSSKLQNRIEDCNLILYIIDAKVPERTRLDIFDRVNSGVPLTRQQMRNSLFMGKATRFLKDESRSEIFLTVTGGSLNKKTMRDREFVNRFCAFQLLELDLYRGDMDDFLATCLRKMNEMEDSELSRLSDDFRRGLSNNLVLFDRHAFRKHAPEQERRSVLNASLWDVMSTGLSHYPQDLIATCAKPLRNAIYTLLDDDEFNIAITYGTNDTKRVGCRFHMTRGIFKETLDAHTD